MREGFLPPPLDFAAFRRENGVLILLNLGVMLGLLGLQLIFRPVLGPLSLGSALALSARFLMQLGELALLARPPIELGEKGTSYYAGITVAAHIAFASFLSSLSSGQESHHIVLLVIPVIAAAFWFRLPWLLLTVAVVTGLTLLQVWIPLGVLPQGQLVEYFEATSVALIFVLVAGVVRLLAHQLWNREEALQRSLSQLGATRDQLVRDERLAAIGKLSFAIAHEIRNPVTMIACSAAAAGRPGAPAETRTECLEIIAQESRRLERLTGDFLSYARQRPLEIRRVSLATTLGAAWGLARHRAEEGGIDLVLDPVEEAEGDLDPFQMQQALLNLLMNALDATPSGGRIRMGGGAGNGRLRLWVEDTGAPVPQGIVERLGEPFQSTKPMGTGLGLAITRSILQAHGGDLILEDNHEGRVRLALHLPLNCPVETT
jgi:signal transduction histidine kinase